MTDSAILAQIDVGVTRLANQCLRPVSGTVIDQQHRITRKFRTLKIIEDGWELLDLVINRKKKDAFHKRIWTLLHSIHSLVLRYLFDCTCRITHDHSVIGHVSGHNRPGSNNGILSNDYSRQ